MIKVRTHFISGLLVLAPIFLTFVVIGYLVRLADAFVVNPLFRVLPSVQMAEGPKALLAKAAIAASVVLFVTLMGVLAERLIFRQILDVTDSLIRRIPVFSKVYGSIRDIAQAFFGDPKGVFRRVVYVQYPSKGIWAMGFVTQDRPWRAHEVLGRDTITVFIPSPPNPATGYFFFFPIEDTVDAGISVEDGIKMVLSGGAVVPPKAAAGALPQA